MRQPYSALSRACLGVAVSTGLLFAAQSAAGATGALLRNDTGLYPRAIRLQYSGGANGRVIASVVSFSGANGIGAIYESTNGGASFVQVGTVADPNAATGLCCSTLYELPRAIGSNPAGTLLWAASIGQSATNRRMALRVWKSTDVGRTWSFLSTVAVAPNTGGLWEPEFSVAADGTLVCHYSDETDGVHSQKLVRARTSDGITWRDFTGTIVSATAGHRPGMPIVRRYDNGTFVMTYEVCGQGGQYDCAVYTRSSSDGWSWGSATDFGVRATTVDGRYFAHAPTISLAPNNALYLIGQMYLNVDGTVAAGNGRTVLINTLNGAGLWGERPAPVSVPGAANNYCPNYSSTLVPSLDGVSMLEIASDYDGTVCKPYFATAPISGPTTLPANVRRSFQVTTAGLTDHYVRHINGNADTAVVTAASDTVTKDDATFMIRAGLGNAGCYSLEAVNFTGQFLRHANSRVILSVDDGSALMHNDATWCARVGRTGSGVSLESLNFPGRFMRHYNGQVWLSSGTGTAADYNTATSFAPDATWNVVGPWSPGGATPTATATARSTATPTARATATATSRVTPTATSTVRPTPTSGAATLLSQGRPAVASSIEGAGFPATAAVDGNTGTRWSSAFADPQWIHVDLGSARNVTRVVLNWEAAYGKAYQLQSSNDAVTWSTFYTTTTSDGAIDDLTVSANGRYVRMYGTARATAWGYSLWELQVYGN